MPSEGVVVSYLFLDLVISRQRAVKQPAFLDLRDVSDEGFVAGLKNLMEDNPISFPILNVVRVGSTSFQKVALLTNIKELG